MQFVKIMLIALAATMTSGSRAEAPQLGGAVIAPSQTIAAANSSPAPATTPALVSIAPILQFDATGHVIKLITQRGTTTYEYQKGKKTVAHLPGNVDVKYYYDKLGRIDHTLSSTGVVRTGLYDKGTGKLVEIVGTDGKTLTLSSDSAGAPSAILTGPNKLSVDFSAIAATIAKTAQSLKLKGTVDEADDDPFEANNGGGNIGGGGGGASAGGAGDYGDEGDAYGGWDGSDDSGDGAGEPAPATPPIERSLEWKTACYNDCRAAYITMRVLVCRLIKNPEAATGCHEIDDRFYDKCNEDCHAGRDPSFF